MQALLDAVCPETSPLAAALHSNCRLDQLTADYSFLFDVGNSGKPPCPLFGGAYGGGDRMKVMEEALRFYHHFGLRLDERNHDMPDQLRTQLEFLHFLAHRQSESIAAGEDSTAYRRAEHDFLERHPGHWIPLMHSRLKESGNVSVYRTAVALLDGVTQRLLDVLK
jgi:DMSO reductase family type II enzyme chaperone